METRRLGKTGHQSTVITYGTAALGKVSQADADRSIAYGLGRGINHFDIAPSYGEAELRVGDYLGRHPQPGLYISCKTNERSKEKAREELLQTLDRLHLDKFDLYQLHAVCTPEDLEACFAPGGSMEAILEAREEGLVGHIGITGHGWQSAATHRAALERFDFSTVMTSCNPFMYRNPQWRTDWDALMAECGKRDVGVQVLKAIARTAWGDRTHTHATWYEPYSDQAGIDAAVAWTLHQPVTTLCAAGDIALLPMICDAAERYQEVGEAALAAIGSDPGAGDFF